MKEPRSLPDDAEEVSVMIVTAGAALMRINCTSCTEFTSEFQSGAGTYIRLSKAIFKSESELDIGRWQAKIRQATRKYT